MPFDTAVSQAMLLSPHNGYKPVVGSVGVEQGRLAYVGERAIAPEEAHIWVDGRGKILMPGLINGHCHGDMTLARGLGDDMTLQEQNEAFEDTQWFYTLITDDDRYYARQLTYAEALLSGTTFILENMYWGLGERSAEAMAATGIRGGLAEDIRPDFYRPDVWHSRETLQRFIGQCKKYGLVPVVGSVSEEDFSREILQGIQAHLQGLDCLQTCHLAETDWRVENVRRQFDATPVNFMHTCGALNSRLIASHAVHVSDAEIQQLAEADVKVVNTPVSEMKIADGIAPIPAYIRAGVTVGLGTDGAMWNNANDLFQEMKSMALLHTVHGGIRSITARDVLDMATMNGAKVFGLQAEMGSIQPGKSADFILVDAAAPHMTPLRTGAKENVASSVVFCATGRDVTDVFVRGGRVVENRRLATVDIRHIQLKVTEASVKIAEQW